jgi:hypothetical protein
MFTETSSRLSATRSHFVTPTGVPEYDTDTLIIRNSEAHTVGRSTYLINKAQRPRKMHALWVTDPTVNLINNYGALDQRSTKLRAAGTSLQTTVSCFIDAAPVAHGLVGEYCHALSSAPRPWVTNFYHFDTLQFCVTGYINFSLL